MKHGKWVDNPLGITLVLLLVAPGAAAAQIIGSSSQTPGLVPQLVNPNEPTYCRADGAAFCAKDEGPTRRACLLSNLDKVSKPCHMALTLTPTTGGPGGFGRPIDAQ